MAKNSFSAVLFCLASWPILLGGQIAFSISGTIVDASDNTPLVGATIKVRNTTLGAVADATGAFSLSGEAATPQLTLEVAYIGYTTQVLRQDVAKKPNAVLRLALRPSAVELDGVEVQGKALGQIKAMIDQKKAESIKNIVSAEQIATFPDLNAAEVMQRIPGITLQRDQGEGRFVQLRGTPPELTTFNINGEQVPSPQGGVRYVGMDIIPADQIDFIEVSKVMTPDMDADGIGGSVNIKTKEAADEIPDVRATLAAGYNNLRQTPNYQLQFTYGQRFKRFGFNLNSSFFQNQQGSDNIEYEFAKGPFFGSQNAGKDNFFIQYREVQLRHYDITRTRISVAPTFDFRLGANSFVYLRAMYNSFTDAETRRRITYELDDALSEVYYLFGGVAHDVRERTQRQLLNTLSLGGEHKIGRSVLDYQVFFAFAEETEPDRIEATFENPGQAIAIQLDTTDRDYPRVVFPNPINGANATRYADFTLDELLFERRRVTDRNLTPRFNWRFPFELGAGSGYFKFGGKIRAKDKARDIQTQDFGAYTAQSILYPGVGPKLSLETLDDGWRETNLLNQGYQMTHIPSTALLRDFYEFYPQHFVFDRNATRTQSFGEDYEAKERIYAAYTMLRLDLARWMLIGGLRYEQTNIDYQGARILLNGNRFLGIDTLTDQRTHRFWLPQVQVKYAVNDNFNLRGAVTYTYARPNFDDVLPYREQDRTEVRFGNPNLRYPRSTNFDFLIERYFRQSLFTGGLFFKKIDDFVFYFKRFAHEGDPKDFGLVEITKAINGNSANVYGAELQAQFKLDFLPGVLKNFGWYLNYTYTRSEARIYRRIPANYSDAVVVFGDNDESFFARNQEQEKIQLPGQAEHTVNVALFYDTKKFFARLSANYQDEFLFQLGADADLDEYYAAALRLDLTANYDLTPHLNLFVDAINLTNTPLRYYLGQTQRVRQQEFYSWWSRVGLKLNF